MQEHTNVVGVIIDGRTLSQLHQSLDDQHIIALDQRHLGQLASNSCDQEEQGRANHQNVISAPIVGRKGNMLTPDRVGGERSYSKK